MPCHSHSQSHVGCRPLNSHPVLYHAATVVHLSLRPAIPVAHSPHFFSRSLCKYFLVDLCVCSHAVLCLHGDVVTKLHNVCPSQFRFLILCCASMADLFASSVTLSFIGCLAGQCIFTILCRHFRYLLQHYATFPCKLRKSSSYSKSVSKFMQHILTIFIAIHIHRLFLYNL